MWRIEAIDTRPNVLEVYGWGPSDFVRLETHSLHADGIELSNDIAIFSEGESKVRVVLCHCGSSGCGAGNWVCLRSLGNHVVWIPVFPSQESDPDSLSGDLSDTPPDYVWERGIPLITPDAWDGLRQIRKDVISIQEIPRLSLSEAIRIVQVEDTHLILGRGGRPPELKVDSLIAVTQGDLKEEIDAVSEFIGFARDSQAPVSPIERSGQPVEFHIDAPGFPSWSVFSRTSESWAIQLPNGPVVVTSIS